MASNEQAAYDLSLFETRKAKLVALKPNKKEIKSNSRRARLQAVFNVSAYVLIAVVVLAVIGAIITTNVRLTELNARIAESETYLAELKSEEVRLQSELAGKTSIVNVNEYAQESGMTLADGNQVCYITVSGSDTVTVSQENTNIFSTIWTAIRGFFS